MTTAHLALEPNLSYFQAIFMGLLQGVTELFPISSLGHGVLFPALFGWHNLVSDQEGQQAFFLTFLVGLHVGTALGLMTYYRSTWFTLFMGLGRQLKKSRNEGLSSLWKLNDEAMDAGLFDADQARLRAAALVRSMLPKSMEIHDSD